MTEQEFIAVEVRKCEKRLRRMLMGIKKTGYAPNKTIELLLINQMIKFTPPCDGFVYNHYKLTELGETELQRIDQ